MALMKQKEILVEAIEQKETALGIFIYFSKACDPINRSIVIYKLNRYEVG